MSESFEQAKEVALRLLEKQAMSSTRLREKLRSRGFSEGVCDEVVSDLQRAGLLDDMAMARDLVDRLMSREPGWRDWLLGKLATRAIAEADAQRVVDEMLGDLDEGECATRAGQKRLTALPTGLGVEVKARRLSGYLARRGFCQEAVTQALDETLGFMTGQ